MRKEFEEIVNKNLEKWKIKQMVSYRKAGKKLIKKRISINQ